MALLEWNDSLRIGVTDVDDQHRQLVGMIRSLHDAMTDGRGKETIGETIDGLISYTQTHFATEEAYFDRYGYAHADAHRAEHRDFVERVQDFSQGFHEGRLFLSIDVMEFLSSWLVEHIQGSDREYGPFLNQQGVA